ncbi:hypothetical protein SUDANB70_02833 [Streptomyces sp. enrichment culture]
MWPRFGSRLGVNFQKPAPGGSQRAAVRSPARSLPLTLGAVLAELHDEWIAFPRRYLSNESMDALLYPDDTIVLPAASND